MLSLAIARWFWLLLTLAVIVWYSTITIYVAIRGGIDIRHMLARLAEQQRSEEAAPLAKRHEP